MAEYVDNKKLTEELGAWAKKARSAIEAGDKPPKMTEYIAECIFLICNNMGFKSSFINYCVDDKTEALTKRGWLSYDDITTDDDILSYNDGKLIWSSINDIYINPSYNEKMFHLSHKNVDALVTPGHKFVSEQEGIKPIEMFTSSDNIVLTGDFVDNTNESNYDDDFIRLVGWVITEGYYIYDQSNHVIELAQNKGKKSEIIENVLKTLSIKCKSYIKQYTDIIVWQLNGDIVKDIMKVAPSKQLTYDFIFGLTQEQRIILIKTMVEGDGWNKGNEGISWSYIQNNKEHIDKFVILCTLSGLSVETHFYDNNFEYSNKPYYVVNTYKNPKKCCRFEHIDLHGGKPKGGGIAGKENNPNIPTVVYNGVIWCPSTEHGTWVCKRNDKVYITGNTYKDDMIGDAIENCIRYVKNFDIDKNRNAFGYVSTIAYYAFVRRIKKENKRHIDHLSYIRTTFAEDDIRNALAADNPNDVKTYVTYIDHMQSILDDMNIEIPEQPSRKKKKRKSTQLEDNMIGEKY